MTADKKGNSVTFATKALSGLAATGVAAASVLALTSTTASASDHTVFGNCPSGAVCVYDGSDQYDIARGPEFLWWSGVYNLNNVFGNYFVVNNQYGGWVIDFCTGYNARGCGQRLPQDAATTVNLTPINSVYLHG